MIELQDFVEKTVTDIVAGVVAASPAVKEKGGDVNPKQYSGAADGPLVSKNSLGITRIEFDVALVASEDSNKQAGFAVAVASAVFGTKAEKRTATEDSTRVRFSVPVAFPTTEERRPVKRASASF